MLATGHKNCRRTRRSPHLVFSESKSGCECNSRFRRSAWVELGLARLNGLPVDRKGKSLLIVSRIHIAVHAQPRIRHGHLPQAQASRDENSRTRFCRTVGRRSSHNAHGHCRLFANGARLERVPAHGDRKDDCIHRVLERNGNARNSCQSSAGCLFCARVLGTLAWWEALRPHGDYTNAQRCTGRSRQGNGARASTSSGERQAFGSDQASIAVWPSIWKSPVAARRFN